MRQPLNEFAANRDDVRVLPGRFIVIEQAMVVPANRPNALQFIDAHVQKLIGSGKVASLIKQFDKHQASVPDQS